MPKDVLKLYGMPVMDERRETVRRESRTRRIANYVGIATLGVLLTYATVQILPQGIDAITDTYSEMIRTINSISTDPRRQ